MTLPASMLLVGGLSLTETAVTRAQRPPALMAIQKVKDNLYIIPGGDPSNRDTFTGGNTAVFVTDRGVVKSNVQTVYNELKK